MNNLHQHDLDLMDLGTVTDRGLYTDQDKREKKSRYIMNSQEFYKDISDFPKNPVLDLQYIFSEKIVLIMDEGQHLSAKVLLNNHTKNLTILSERQLSQSSLDLRFTSTQDVLVRVIGLPGDVKISNAKQVSTRWNGGVISVKRRKASYWVLRKDRKI